MTTFLTLGLCSLLTLSDGAPAERLEAVCESLASAPSATFEMNLLPLGRMEEVRSTNGRISQIGIGGGTPQRLVIRRETGKPEHLRLDDAEVFRFPGGLLVGRLGEGNWAVCVAPPDADDCGVKGFTVDDGSTALDRLVFAARSVPFPAALMAQVRDEIREAESEVEGGETVLRAALNGHSTGNSTLASARSSDDRDVDENSSVTAHLRSNGSVASISVGRSVRHGSARGGMVGFWAHTFEPSAIGSTRVDVPPEVTALAGK